MDESLLDDEARAHLRALIQCPETAIESAHMGNLQGENRVRALPSSLLLLKANCESTGIHAIDSAYDAGCWQ